MISQLPLGITLRDEATLANFVAGANAQALALAGQAGLADSERFVYIFGGQGTGKTHLLQAICHVVAQRGGACAYLPLDAADDLAPEMLEGLAALDVVCIDGLDTIAGQSEWEAALFQLYNQVRDGQSTLWFAARTSVQQIAISLPDLLSRLRACLSVPIVELTDEDKLAAVQLRARHRGFDLSDEVGQFLLRRFPRDMSSLFALLEQLDRESLAAQRRITIPFVKEVISHGG